MDKKVASERLRALAADDRKRSKAARLRDVIDDVEATLAAGVSRADVVTELAALGLDMSLATFETTLKRIRQKRGKASPSRAAPNRQGFTQELSQPQAAAAAEALAEARTSASGSHNPADLNKIIGASPDLNALAKHAKRNR